MARVKILFLPFIVFFSLLLLTCDGNNDTSRLTFRDFNNIIRDVVLRPGVTADIYVSVYENENEFCDSLRELKSQSDEDQLNERTIFAVHPRNSDGSSWGPFVEAIFNENPTGEVVCRFVALDQPGHGNSSLPFGDLLFGEISHSDYVNTVLGTLDNLAKYGIRPISIIGFSTGGAVVQLTQQKLMDEGTNLFEKYKILRVTLFAPVPTAPVFWHYLGIDFSSMEAHIFSCFGMVATTEPCSDVDFADDDIIDWNDIYALWLNGVRFDCDPKTVPIGDPLWESVPPDCEPSPPGLGDVFNEFGLLQDEPFTIMRESVGTPPQNRISTDLGIFEENSLPELQIVVFKNDSLIYPVPEVGQDMYIHLTGDHTFHRFKVAEGAEDDHIMVLANPSGMLESIAGTIVLP
jgi:pimeloyl-ACP methyl ester carboxylesterase